jgi:tetratricopeptide (TPR) repeat protein
MTTGLELLQLSDEAFARNDFAGALEQARAALAAGLDLDVPGSERGEYWSHPQLAHAEIVIGMALLELHEADAALAHLDKAVALDRDDARTWANRGHLRRERGELALALADLDQALSIDAAYAYARFRRAQTLLSLNRPLDAETDLESILRLNPYDAQPRALWQTLRAERGVLSDLDSLPALKSTASLFRRAWLHIEHAEPALAVRDLTAAYELAPEPYLLASLAHAHGLAGNLAAARENAECYLAADPSHLGMRGLLNEMILRQEKGGHSP